MKTDCESDDDDAVLYRLEVGGPVAASWIEWFEADKISPAGENTVLEVRVTDQSQLYGRLRRIHDLNLRLISVTLEGPREDRVKDESIDHCNHPRGESQ